MAELNKQIQQKCKCQMIDALLEEYSDELRCNNIEAIIKEALPLGSKIGVYFDGEGKLPFSDPNQEAVQAFVSYIGDKGIHSPICALLLFIATSVLDVSEEVAFSYMPDESDWDLHLKNEIIDIYKIAKRLENNFK